MKAKLTIEINGTIYSGESELHEAQFTNTKPLTKIKKSKPITPTQIIKDLYSTNFFSTQKKLSEVVTQFISKGYNLSQSDIQIPLNRAKFLRRDGKRGNYAYVQKYPSK